MFFVYFIFLYFNNILSFSFSNNDNIPLTLNGTWELEKSNTDCTDEILKLIGIDSFKRKIIIALNVIEKYEITEKYIHFKRDTARTHKDQIFNFNIEEIILDDILGSVKQLVHYNDGKLIMSMHEQNNGKTSTVRKLSDNNKNKLVYTSNYTKSNGVSKSCIRYFIRK